MCLVRLKRIGICFKLAHAYRCALRNLKAKVEVEWRLECLKGKGDVVDVIKYRRQKLEVELAVLEEVHVGRRGR